MGCSTEASNALEVGENALRVNSVGVRRLLTLELSLVPREPTPGKGGELLAR